MTKLQLAGGRYELGKILDRVGRAEVRKGRDRSLDRKVVVILHPARRDRHSGAADALLAHPLLERALFGARLIHPNIVAVYDAGVDLIDGRKMLYVVMEYVASRPLREVVRENEGLSVERAKRITADVLSALGYGHGAGILHLRVEPRTVLMASTDHVKLANCGITTWLNYSDVETAQYMAPELTQGEPPDSRSDIYSAGCLLYYMLTGGPPFVGQSAVSIAYSHLKEVGTAPSLISPGAIPARMDAIVLRALAKERSDRFESAEQMRSALRSEFTAAPAVRSPTRADSSPGLASSQRRLLQPPAAARQSRPVAVRPAIPSPIELKRPIVTQLVQSGRRSEPIGEEVRSFNNSMSSSTAVERITVRSTSRVSVSVDVRNARALSGSGGVNFLNVAEVQAQLRNEVARQYSLKIDTEIAQERSTEISVPAHKNLKVVFRWMRIWDQGVARLADQSKPAVALAQVPFEFTTSLAFDWKAEELPSHQP
jgi:serine/threonine protein kinase